MPVLGATELRVGAQHTRERPRDISRELRTARTESAKPLQKEVKASAGSLLPKRGRYAGIMSRAVKVSRRSYPKYMTLRIFAIGKKEERDVWRVNKGELRHPVFGHRANWSTTHVTRGFVDRPVDLFAKRLHDETEQAIDRALERV